MIAGPLYISDELEEKAYQSKIELPQNQLMLDELDSASTLGLSDSQVRKERLRGQIAPFDIVDEYNRAVEVWNNGVQPSTTRLEAMIMNISEFMAWFSHNMNAVNEPTPFLRKTLNFDMLRDIGVDQKKVLDRLTLGGVGGEGGAEGEEENADGNLAGGAPTTPKQGGGINEEDDEVNNGGSPEKYGSGGPGLIKPRFYYFNRWVWIMFPWLGLKHAGTYSEQMMREKNRLKQIGRLSKLMGSENDSKKRELIKKQIDQLKNEGGRTNQRKGALMLEDGDSTFLPPPGDREQGSTMLEDEISKKEEALKKDNKDSRFWDIKKMNPREEPHFKSSSSRNSAMVAALGGKVSAANRMFDKLNEENKVLGIAPREKVRPARMNCVPTGREGDEGDGSDAKGPFSYSSQKSISKGSRFPSVEKFHKESVHSEELALDKAAQKAIERFGGQEPPQTLEELIDLRQSEEMPFSAANGGDLGYLPAHSLTFATTNEDAFVAQAFAKAGKLRQVFDLLVLERKQKEEKLEDMRRGVDERDRRDQHTYEKMMAGEEVMEMLQTRLERMNNAVKEASYLGEFFQRIELVLTANPAKDKRHLDGLEQQLALSRQQLEDMLKKRSSLYSEKDDIEKRQHPRLKNEIKKARMKKLKLEPQLEQKRKELDETKRRLELRSQGGIVAQNSIARQFSVSPQRGAMKPHNKPSTAQRMRNSTPDESSPPAIGGGVGVGDGVKGSISDRTISIFKNTGGAVGSLFASATRASEERKKKLESAMENLENVVGMTDGKDLVDKYFGNQKLEANLQHTVKIHEHKVAKLKNELATLQNELEELQFAGDEDEVVRGGMVTVSEMGSKISEKESIGSATGTTVAKSVISEDERNDVRKMDQRVNKMEVRCGQEKRKLERQAYLIHKVSNGIGHLKRLLDVADQHYRLPLVKSVSMVAFDDVDVDVKTLQEVEEKIVAVIARITLGTNKQIGDDQRLTIAQRQSQIAEAIVGARMTEGRLTRPQIRDKLEEKVAPHPASSSAVVNSPPSIRIKTAVDMDKDFDGDMKMVLMKNDMNADLEEAEILAADVDTGTEEINKFITEACSTEESIREQRKSNLLSGSEVTHKDMGLTMGIVLAETEARLAKENGSGKMAKMGSGGGKKSPRSAIAVNDRNKMKKMSSKLVKKKLREAEKIALERIAEEKAAML